VVAHLLQLLLPAERQRYFVQHKRESAARGDDGWLAQVLPNELDLGLLRKVSLQRQQVAWCIQNAFKRVQVLEQAAY